MSSEEKILEILLQREEDISSKRAKGLAELREEVRLLRTVVAQHSRDIEALKAAQ